MSITTQTGASALGGIDLSHLSEQKRALLAKRLKGREIAQEADGPYAPTALIKDPDAWYEPCEPRAFQKDQLSCMASGEGGFRLFMETRRKDLDVERFRDAWRKLYRHYDVMRSRIVDGHHVVNPPDTPYDITCIDARCYSASDRLAILQYQRQRFHDLSWGQGGHAVEVAVVRVDDDTCCCLFSFDQLVMDLPSTEFLALRCRRIYEGVFDQEHRPHFAIRDYRVTEDAYLASVDGQGALRYWQRKLERAEGRLRASDLLDPDQACSGIGYGYRCDVLDRESWARLRGIAQDRGLSEFSVLQTLFMDLLARQSGRDRFGIETRFFQRLPFDPSIYELLGPFTLGHVALREGSFENVSFAERCRLAQKQAEQDQAYAYIDAASHWHATEGPAERGQKIAFTNTCIRFEEFVKNSLVPPLRWLGDLQTIWQAMPDTALEYVLVENDLALENHWFVNHSMLPVELTDRLYKPFMAAMRALSESPSLWDQPCVFDDVAGSMSDGVHQTHQPSQEALA